jgi:ParB family chromosome partitioning protein
MVSSQSIFNIPTQGIITDVLISRIYHSNFLLRDVSCSLEELKSSIVQRGLLHPIIVRAVGDQFEVVAGNRRFAACKQLGWKRITCHVLELDDKDAFEVSITENIQHRTLNAVEEAVAYKRYVEEYGWGGVSELAGRIGKSHSYVSNRIRLLELPQEVLDQIVCGRTNTGTIQEILAIQDEDQRLVVAREVIDNDLTREQVRSLVKANPDRGGFDYVSNKCTPSKKEIIFHEKEKAIFRFITTLRIALMRLDDTMEAINNNDWILWENLMHYRAEIHRQIDELIVLRGRSKLHFNKVQSL